MTRNATFIATLLAFTFMLSCSDKDSAQPNNNQQPNNTPSYTLSFKLDGVLYSTDSVTAKRNLSTQPNMLSVIAYSSNGSLMAQIVTTESFIGFVNGLNVGCTDNSFPSHYVKVWDTTNKEYTTATTADGVDVFFSKLSYTADGAVEGKFSGTVKNSSGTDFQITDGTFKTICEN